METPNYIKSLILPSNGQKPVTRRVWSIDLMIVWLPFLNATNVMGETVIAPDALGAPLRLAYASDGSVKFSKSGRPVMRVAKEIADTVRLVRENFTASLISYANGVVADKPEEFKAHLQTAQKAGEPIVNSDRHNLEQAIAQAQAEAVKEAEKKARVEAKAKEREGALVTA